MGRTEPGVWSLPNGDALYRYDIRAMTTTNMDPEQIHEIGLKEVERIEGEELAIAKKLGFQRPEKLPGSAEEQSQSFRHLAGRDSREI